MSTATAPHPPTTDPSPQPTLFEKDASFWANYESARARPPPSLFTRILSYHAAHGGRLHTAHDVGAGSGPYAPLLAAHFEHVILSDVAASNMALAQQRLGPSAQFSYRAAALDDAAGIAPRSVDLVFASNVLHFAADQHGAMAVLARQLAPGGTLAVAVFGPARFADAALQSVWARISQAGGRALLRTAERPAQIAGVMARTDGYYNVAPLDEALYAPGALRLHLNMRAGGLTPLLPAEVADVYSEPAYTGPADVQVFEEEEGWGFEVDARGVREHMMSFPWFDTQAEGMAALLEELESVLAPGGAFAGCWPAKLILATAL